jgi:uncharacterized protein YicC (UPF0701 family)
MPTQDDNTSELITIYYRRLQELRKQKAFYGARADPSILMEIDDIEAKIAELQKELNENVPQREFSLSKKLSHRFEFVPPKRKPDLRNFRQWLLGK